MHKILGSLSNQAKPKVASSESSQLFLNVSKNILARESIFLNLDCNTKHQLKKVPSYLSQQQIKTSMIYQKFLQRIQKSRQKEQQEKRQFQKEMEKLTRQVESVKMQVRENKVQIWEKRNEVLQLEEILDEQNYQYEYLCQELKSQSMGLNEDEDQCYNGYDQGQSAEVEQGQSCIQSRLNQQQDQQQNINSKPACSIKCLMSDRSITSQNFQNQGVSVGQGVRLFTESDNQDFTQLFVKNQTLCQNTNPNIASFKRRIKAPCLIS